MPLLIVRNDITHMRCDAIVNAANNSLLGGGGVDGAIHSAAGRGLYEECLTLGGCETGEAKITGAYRLPCKYVIHTVGPVYYDGTRGEEGLLRSCYKNSLLLAARNCCKSVAFPLISAGVYGYPREAALNIAVEEITAFLNETDGDMLVYIVVFDNKSFCISEKLVDEIGEYLAANYVETRIDDDYAAVSYSPAPELLSSLPCEAADMIKADKKMRKAYFNKSAAALNETAECEDEAEDEDISDIVDLFDASAAVVPASLDERLKTLDESFSQMLLRKIDEKGMTDAECYKKANIDRKLFSKIRNDIYYKPKKQTVLAFAVALELPLDETENMLMKAGFAFSHSSKGDVIIEYFISKGNYNIFEINEVLFRFDQSLLGV